MISGTLTTYEPWGSGPTFSIENFNIINQYNNFILALASENDETPYDGYYFTVRIIVTLFKINGKFYGHCISPNVSDGSDVYSFYDSISLSLSNNAYVYLNDSSNYNYNFRGGTYRYVAWN